jgi:hydrogenase expression/formation protein HypC
MCIGLPMRVIEGDDMTALCERGGEAVRLSMLLVGAPAPGAFVLAHLGAAVRVLEPQEARLIDEALLGLAEAVEGGDYSARFTDLIGREPQLPEHLRPAQKN